MKWKERTSEQVAEMICGDKPESYFRYLTGPNLSQRPYLTDCCPQRRC